MPRGKVGRLLISGALAATLIGPNVADWNESHNFSPAWPPHARFHNIVSLSMTSALCLVGLWLVWRPSPDPDTQVRVAALVPVLYWGSFFIAILVPGTAVEDREGTLPRLAGIPVNLAVAGALTLLSAIGYWAYRRERSPLVKQSGG